MTFATSEGLKSAVLELSDPVLTDDQLSFSVRLLGGALPNEGASISDILGVNK